MEGGGDTTCMYSRKTTEPRAIVVLYPAKTCVGSRHGRGQACVVFWLGESKGEREGGNRKRERETRSERVREKAFDSQ